MTAVYAAARTLLTLGPEVARGGEGVVRRVRERPDQVAKLYAPGPPPRAAEKLEAMLARRPADPTAARLGHTSIAWPTEPLHDGRGTFVGFLMPGIFDGRPLVDVYNRKRRAQVLPEFDRRYLHRTAANFAAAIGALHAHGLVVGDLNESNVLVRPNALVTLIDTDSYQVPNLRGRQPLIFPCPVGKVEYTPPELQGRSFAGTVRTQEHDRFALAVLIFQLLMEGSHPFRARWLGQGEPPSTDQKISEGLFPHARPAPRRIAPPPGLPSLDVLHPEVAALLRRCFVEGHRDPAKRPAPGEWERGLAVAERALARCRNGHWYGGHLAGCTWCGLMPDRRPVARRRGAPETGETPRRPAIPVAPSPVPRSTPFPPKPAGTGRTAWRNAMVVSVLATLILALVTTNTNMFGFGPVPLRPEERPTPRLVQPTLPVREEPVTRLPAERRDEAAPGDDTVLLPLDVGDQARVVGQADNSTMSVHRAPDWQSGILGFVDEGSIVEITGDGQTGDGYVWWPVLDPGTDVRGYIWQRYLEPLASGQPTPRG